MMGKSFLEHILNDRNDRAFERHPRQLGGTTSALRKIVAHAECDGAQCSIAIGKRYGSALDQVAEAGFRHGLQQRVLVRIVQVKGGPVQGGLVCDLLHRDVFELLLNS